MIETEQLHRVLNKAKRHFGYKQSLPDHMIVEMLLEKLSETETRMNNYIDRNLELKYKLIDATMPEVVKVPAKVCSACSGVGHFYGAADPIFCQGCPKDTCPDHCSAMEKACRTCNGKGLID